MATEAQLRAQAKYNRANTVQITLRLNKRTEADIISRLESMPNKQGYLKRLIRDEGCGMPEKLFLALHTVSEHLKEA